MTRRYNFETDVFVVQKGLSDIKLRKSCFHDLFSRSMTRDYRGLQGVTRGYKGLKGLQGGYKG